MAAQISMPTEKSPSSSRAGKLTNGVNSGSTPITAAPHEFATGLQSLLDAINGSPTEMHARSADEARTSELAVPATQTQLAGNVPAHESGSVPAVLLPGSARVPIQQKLLPSNQQNLLPSVQPKPIEASPETKESQSSRSRESADVSIRLKTAKGAPTDILPDPSAAPPIDHVALLTTTSAVSLLGREQTPTGKEEPPLDLARMSSFPADIPAVHRRVARNPLLAIANDLGNSTDPEQALNPQMSELDVSLGSETLDNQMRSPISPLSSPLEQVATTVEFPRAHSSPIPDLAPQATIANPLNPPIGATLALNSNPNQTPSRRIDAAQSASRSIRSMTHSAASYPTIDAGQLHSPAQGAAASSIVSSIANHDGEFLDRRAYLASPANNSFPLASADREPFAVLDGATAGPQTTWIHAGAHHAEAGYLDPSLGWVTVRADGIAGGMHAALVPGSPEAASVLSNQLAGLNAFMADHQGHNATVTLASPESGGAHAGTAQQDNSMNGQSSHQQQQDHNPSAPFTRDSNPSSDLRDRDNTASHIFVDATKLPNGSGVHLSVMA